MEMNVFSPDIPTGFLRVIYLKFLENNSRTSSYITFFIKNYIFEEKGEETMDKRLFRMGLVIGAVMLFIGAGISQSTVNIGEKCVSKDAMKFCETYKSGNNKPRIINPYPKNGSENIALAGTPINAEIYDDDNDKMRSEIWSNFTGKWVKYAGWGLSDDCITQFLVDYNGDDKWDSVDRNHYISNGGNLESGRYGFFENRSITMNWKMTSSGTKYYWSVNVTDGIGWTNDTYHFTTESITIYVDDNYDNSTPGWNVTHFNKIQDGMYAANENDTVFVYSGRYEEYVILDKPIRLIGENRESTFITGEYEEEPNDQKEEYVVLITAEMAEFSGFSIVGEGFGRDGTVKGINLGNMRNTVSRNYITECVYGIAAINKEHDVGVRNNFIYGNKIYNCQMAGVYLEKSHDNTISLNVFEKIDCGNQGAAIYLVQSNANNIVENFIEDCKIGIGLEGTLSQNNIVNHNKISSTQTNVLLKGAGIRNLITTNDLLYPNKKPEWGYIYIENTRDTTVIGNYYKDYGLKIKIIPWYASFGKLRFRRIMPVVDLSAAKTSNFKE